MRVGGLGAPELLLIVVAIVLVFGAGKLGDIGGSLGRSMREFKKAQAEDAAATPTAMAGDVPSGVSTAHLPPPPAYLPGSENHSPAPEYRPDPAPSQKV